MSPTRNAERRTFRRLDRGVVDVETGEHLGEDEQTRDGDKDWPLMFLGYGEVAPVRVA